jgi:hypothetical protein
MMICIGSASRFAGSFLHLRRYALRTGWVIAIMIAATVCSHGCFATGAGVTDDLTVVSERDLYRLNEFDRQGFLESPAYGGLSVVVSARRQQPYSLGLGVSKLFSPGHRWDPERPKDASSFTVIPEHSIYPPGFVVVLPEQPGFLFPVRQRSAEETAWKLALWNNDTLSLWPVPGGSAVIALLGSSWIPGEGEDVFLLLGVNSDLTLVLWDVSLSEEGQRVVFREKARSGTSHPSKAFWGYTGPLFWSPKEHLLYAIAFPTDSKNDRTTDTEGFLFEGTPYGPSFLTRLDPKDLSFTTIARATQIHGISEEGLIYSVTHWPAHGTEFSDLLLRSIPDGHEKRLGRMRGAIRRGALSPDGRYVVFPNAGCLHDPVFTGYGPTVCFLWDLGSGSGFIVDVSYETDAILSCVAAEWGGS